LNAARSVFDKPGVLPEKLSEEAIDIWTRRRSFDEAALSEPSDQTGPRLTGRAGSAAAREGDAREQAPRPREDEERIDHPARGEQAARDPAGHMGEAASRHAPGITPTRSGGPRPSPHATTEPAVTMLNATRVGTAETAPTPLTGEAHSAYDGAQAARALPFVAHNEPISASEVTTGSQPILDPAEADTLLVQAAPGTRRDSSDAARRVSLPVRVGSPNESGKILRQDRPGRRRARIALVTGSIVVVCAAVSWGLSRGRRPQHHVTTNAATHAPARAAPVPAPFVPPSPVSIAGGTDAKPTAAAVKAGTAPGKPSAGAARAGLAPHAPKAGARTPPPSAAHQSAAIPRARNAAPLAAQSSRAAASRVEAGQQHSASGSDAANEPEISAAEASQRHAGVGAASTQATPAASARAAVSGERGAAASGEPAASAAGAQTRAGPSQARPVGNRPANAAITPLSNAELGMDANEGSEPGYLSLDTAPWSEVFLGSTPLGTTPIIRVPLSPGRHLLTLKNSELGTSTSYVVEIKSGRTVSRLIGWAQ
jgi:hypothetical protein